MRIEHPLLLVLLLPICWGCVKDITADIPTGPLRLVVEGRVTDQAGPYTVRLSETEALYDSVNSPPGPFSPATGAFVQIVDDQGGRIELIEGNPGVYTSNLVRQFRGVVGRSYKVIIETEDGRRYESKPELMHPVPEIDEISIIEEEIRGEITPVLNIPFVFNPVLNNQPLNTPWHTIVNPIFVENVSTIFALDDPPFLGLSGFILGWFNAEDNAQILDDTEILIGLMNDSTVTQADLLSLATITQAPPLRPPTRGFRIMVKATDPIAEKNYYRWSFKGTFAVDTEPEKYTFLAVNRQGTLQYAVNSPKSCCSQCWFTFQFDDVVIMDDRLVDGSRFEKETVIVPLEGLLFDQRFHIEIQQTSLTFEAYKFYQAIQSQTESVGSIFDTTPAILQSNISNVDDPSEIVLGYFMASAMKTRSSFLGTDTDIVLLDEFVYHDDCRTIGNSRIQPSLTKPDFWPN